MQGPGLGCDVHPLDLGGSIGKLAKRSDSDGAAGPEGEQETTRRRLVGIELCPNYRSTCGCLTDAVLLEKLLRSPGQVLGHQSRSGILVGCRLGLSYLDFGGVQRTSSTPLAPRPQASRRDVLALAGSKFRKGEGSVPLAIAGQENQRRKYGLGFLEADVDLTAEAAVPSESGARKSFRSLLAQEEAEFERLSQSYVLELRASRKRFGVAAIECAPEASARRALRGHEQMFPRMPVSAT
jgi:hypothetical protein